MSESKYEIVVYGATSFVGQILCRYLVEQYPNNEIRWAAAGRSSSKLKEVIGALGKDIPTIVAEADDETAIQNMVDQTDVVITTVGPYALYGPTLVKVCANSGKDYVDLTGEPQFIRRMLDEHEEAAKASGARIVHCCGFDSIPLDLGNYFVQQQAQEKYGSACTEVKMAVNKMRGGGSGGTIASGINMIKEASKDASLRKGLTDPYYLCSGSHGFSANQRDVKSAVYDEDFKAWVGPFIMAAINTKIVHRSNQLLNKAFGENFKYDEVMRMGTGFGSRIAGIGLGIGMAVGPLFIALPPSRYVIEKIVPQPGEGPSPEQQEKGFFDLRFVGKTDKGEILRAKVTGDKDPGYGSTAKMLAQSGLCLAQDISKSQVGGGFWTTASAMGDALIKRLEEQAGLTFSITE